MCDGLCMYLIDARRDWDMHRNWMRLRSPPELITVVMPRTAANLLAYFGGFLAILFLREGDRFNFPYGSDALRLFGASD